FRCADDQWTGRFEGGGVAGGALRGPVDVQRHDVAAGVKDTDQVAPGAGRGGGGGGGGGRGRGGGVGGGGGGGAAVLAAVVHQVEGTGSGALGADACLVARAGGLQVHPCRHAEAGGGVHHRSVGGDLLAGGAGERRGPARPGDTGGVGGVAGSGGV